MRAFLILCSVISAAYAAGLGYNYESNNGPALAGGFVGGPVLGGQALASPSYAGQALSGLSFVGQAIASPSYSAPAPVPEVNKEFFSYTAPENEFNNIGNAGDIANSLKKNLRVIFVKGPQNSGLENAALQLLSKSAVEERTAIYVLNKQADIGDLANKLNSINHRSAYKPEVHFVKYRTPADAEHAKHAIQSQYDNLGGNTSSYNSGVAPVLDFATKPAAPAAQQPIGSVEGAYLPPNKV